MTKNRKKIRQVVFFADLSMHLAVDDHQVKQRKIAIGLHVLNGKSMRPVVRYCILGRKVTKTAGSPTTCNFLVTRAYDANRIGVIRVLMEVAADAGR
ncbi:MAG: hypothetical protein ACK48S_09825, partial [Planctomycetia bacterium]